MRSTKPEITQTSVRIPKDLLRKVKHASIDRRESLSNAIIAGLEWWLAEGDKKPSGLSGRRVA